MGGDCNSLIDGNALGPLSCTSPSYYNCNSLIDGNALGPEKCESAYALYCNSLIDGNALGQKRGQLTLRYYCNSLIVSNVPGSCYPNAFFQPVIFKLYSSSRSSLINDNDHSQNDLPAACVAKCTP